MSVLPDQISLAQYLSGGTQMKPGDIVNHPGRELTFDEVVQRVGQQIVYDQSTESHSWYKVVLVENVILNPSTGCKRLILFDGDRQRLLVDEYDFDRKRTYLRAAAYELPAKLLKALRVQLERFGAEVYGGE